MSDERESQFDYKSAYQIVKSVIGLRDDDPVEKQTEGLKKLVTDIQNEIRNIAPQLGTVFEDFEAEYERFKEFLLYKPLIKKNIVALGGAFSSGKSSFLNDLMEASLLAILPESDTATTSIPTYVLRRDSGSGLSGVNCFGCRFQPDKTAIREISHVGISGGGDGITLSHVIRTLFFETKQIPYEHIAFLDTPGYSKGERTDGGRLTDRQIAKRQMDSADCILWFINSQKGSLTQEDINFLRELNSDIPKLFIVSMADEIPTEARADIKNVVKNSLAANGISTEGVLLYSRKDESACERSEIEAFLQKWNVPNTKHRFAHNFKRLFAEANDWCMEQSEKLGEQLELIKNLQLIGGDDFAVRCKRAANELQEQRTALEEKKDKLDKLQYDFFRELKKIGDEVGIDLPEPSMVELVGDSATDALSVLNRCLEKQKIKRNKELSYSLEQTLSGVEPTINRDEGGIDYRKKLLDTLKTLEYTFGYLEMGE